MMIESAPIRRTLAFSTAAHILIVGAAFAFAQYGGGLHRHDHAVIAVSLVNEDRSGEFAGRLTQQVKELLPGQDSSGGTTDRTPVEPTPAMPDAYGRAKDGAPLEQKDEGRADEQGAGNENRIGESAAEGPVDSSEEKNFGYTSAEWQLLHASLERAKTYPRLARERGIEGTVLVRFRASPSGTIEQVDVVKSSGARILDEASVETVYRAAPVPYVDGWVEVPMSYVLK